MAISTLSFNSATRTSLTRLQSQLSEANQVVANNGRVADVGKTLGRLTGSAVSARSLETSMKEQKTSNTLVSVRLQNIDASLATIYEGSEDVANNLTAATAATRWETIVTIAQSGLQQMTGALNASSAGEYLFGGDNTDQRPITLYDGTASPSPSSQAQQKFADFLAAAGKTRDTVSAAEMTAFLTTGYVDNTDPANPVTYRLGDLFDTGFTQASTGTIESRISKTETIVSSASADDQSFRDIAAAYTALADLDLANLNAGARQALTDQALKTLKGAGQSITDQRANLGSKLTRIEASNDELLRKQDIAARTLSDLEEVDLTEASLRVTTLETQLEAAYTVTGRLQRLSILDYI